MNIIQILIFSLVEGITEFLPISSTGHLILVSDLLKITQTEFVKSFEIIIQLGAILSVVVIYFNKLIKNIDIWKQIIVAFLPSAIFGALFYKLIKTYLLSNSLVVVLSLILGGIVMILFEKYHKDKEKDLNLKHFLLIGLFQVISMVPGVSRAFATIFGGMIVGMSRKKATEFSFFLAIPTMLGATVLDLLKTDVSVWTNSNLVTLLLGFLASFATAYVVVKWLIKFVQTHDFVGFGWYRIVLAILFSLFYL